MCIRDSLNSIPGPQDPNLSAMVSAVRQYFEPFLSLLLYLCSPDAEWAGPGGAARPQRASTKDIRRARYARASAEPRLWVSGQGLGTLLRRERPATGSHQSEHTGRKRPTPYYRRPHWTTVWTGPKGQQTPESRWIRPLWIGGTAEQTAAPIKLHRAGKPRSGN